ncbi:MAG: hypothetical protein B6A08_14945 [Sorangiineae bacterium NIC37A_2]|nr:MAG: hypothetical protein B6A08_14945 [Sorangiineae bacterium NIC37A_2]
MLREAMPETDREPREDCSIRVPSPPTRRERGVLWVVLLTAVMMVIEIAFGYATGSMALLADGWHMATHVGALGLASLTYWFSRRFALHPAFAFGTGKVRALGGYTSAVALGFVALTMAFESIERLISPEDIDFASSLPVAVLGLVVNLVSALLLHSHDDGHDHEHGHEHESHSEGHGHGQHHGHGHDHNHRAALLHVIADALTSVLAIAALLAGRYYGWLWLDPITGIVGGVLIVVWAVSLARHAALELLDATSIAPLEQEIRRSLEQVDDVRVHDLHVWSLGGAKMSCIATVESKTPRDPEVYRAQLKRFALAHLTIEVRSPTGSPAAS